MKVRRLIHKGWEEWNTKMPMKLRKQSMFGEEGWAGNISKGDRKWLLE